jgi:transcriptional regulator with XRE-family HTH domain
MNTTAKNPHQGNNVKRIREMLGIKQEALAISLGLSQQTVSQLEQKEQLDPSMLKKLSKVLGVSEEAIKNFSEEVAINIVSTTFNSHDNSRAASIQYNCDPFDKWLEIMEENRKLYERLLQSEKEKNELLQQLLAKNSAS